METSFVILEKQLFGLIDCGAETDDRSGAGLHSLAH